MASQGIEHTKHFYICAGVIIAIAREPRAKIVTITIDDIKIALG